MENVGICPSIPGLVGSLSFILRLIRSPRSLLLLFQARKSRLCSPLDSTASIHPSIVYSSPYSHPFWLIFFSLLSFINFVPVGTHFVERNKISGLYRKFNPNIFGNANSSSRLQSLTQIGMKMWRRQVRNVEADRVGASDG